MLSIELAKKNCTIITENIQSFPDVVLTLGEVNLTSPEVELMVESKLEQYKCIVSKVGKRLNRQIRGISIIDGKHSISNCCHLFPNKLETEEFTEVTSLLNKSIFKTLREVKNCSFADLSKEYLINGLGFDVLLCRNKKLSIQSVEVSCLNILDYCDESLETLSLVFDFTQYSYDKSVLLEKLSKFTNLTKLRIETILLDESVGYDLFSFNYSEVLPSLKCLVVDNQVNYLIPDDNLVGVDVVLVGNCSYLSRPVENNYTSYKTNNSVHETLVLKEDHYSKVRQMNLVSGSLVTIQVEGFETLTTLSF